MNPITVYQMEDIPSTVAIVLQLGRRSAYNAAYIALPQELTAELWTFDGRLAHNAARLGFPVRLIETTSSAGA